MHISLQSSSSLVHCFCECLQIYTVSNESIRFPWKEINTVDQQLCITLIKYDRKREKNFFFKSVLLIFDNEYKNEKYRNENVIKIEKVIFIMLF